MAGTRDDSDSALKRYRSYLLMLARLHQQRRLRAKFDPSDVVQTVLLRAQAQRDQFRGQGELERLAWLRAILANALAEEARRFGRLRRDARRERSLEAELQASSARMEGWLAAQQSSPSQRAQREEQLIRLAEALAELPEDQRRAVELHHLDGRSLADTAAEMGRSREAVAGLLFRALKNLRGSLSAARGDDR